MQITLNGQTLRLDAPLTVAQLLERQGMTGKRIAVERNGEIVPRGRHAETWVAPDDRLEVVVAVGGG
ncbi:MAG TPA: sulfur carrier protein ThiS [Rhodocyclaceae bacterium]|nr:sulfur carrier protein ThiS [Rhodocyclaceae bacterium]